MALTDEEVVGLRRYLMDGGFLMVDDFWGERQWEQVASEFRRVFPGRTPLDLPLDHEIFTTPYPVTTKPMLPNISNAARGLDFGEQGATEAYYRAILDDTGRVMVLLCHNTDFGDAWEWSLSEEYPREIIEEQALPLSLNIAVYALTH